MLERRRLGPYIRIQHSIPVYSVAHITVCWGRDTVIASVGDRTPRARSGHWPPPPSPAMARARSPGLSHFSVICESDLEHFYPHLITATMRSPL